MVSGTQMNIVMLQIWRVGTGNPCQYEMLCLSAGVCTAVRHDAGRPGHASHLRRVAQHREGRGALPGRQAEDAARAPERLDASAAPAPPAHTRRLPGTASSVCPAAAKDISQLWQGEFLGQAGHGCKCHTIHDFWGTAPPTFQPNVLLQKCRKRLL